MMQKDEVLSLVFERFGTEPEYPFAQYPQYAVLRHPNKKWYGVLMNLPRNKFNLAGEGNIDVLNVKCDPDLSGSMRLHPSIYPGYHMNKESWLSVLLDGSVDLQEVGILLEISYDMIGAKRNVRKKG